MDSSYLIMDLAKDPFTAGPLARSTTLIFNVDSALVLNWSIRNWFVFI